MLRLQAAAATPRQLMLFQSHYHYFPRDATPFFADAAEQSTRQFLYDVVMNVRATTPLSVPFDGQCPIAYEQITEAPVTTATPPRSGPRLKQPAAERFRASATRCRLCFCRILSATSAYFSCCEKRVGPLYFSY